MAQNANIGNFWHIFGLTYILLRSEFANGKYCRRDSQPTILVKQKIDRL